MQLTDLDRKTDGIEKQFAAWVNQNEVRQRIMYILGVGPLVAILGDVGAFRLGRQFAAYIGLVPKQTGIRGKVELR